MDSIFQKNQRKHSHTEYIPLNSRNTKWTTKELMRSHQSQYHRFLPFGWCANDEIWLGERETERECTREIICSFVRIRPFAIARLRLATERVAIRRYLFHFYLNEIVSFARGSNNNTDTFDTNIHIANAVLDDGWRRWKRWTVPRARINSTILFSLIAYVTFTLNLMKFIHKFDEDRAHKPMRLVALPGIAVVASVQNGLHVQRARKIPSGHVAKTR